MKRLFDSILYRWKRYQLGVWSPFRSLQEDRVRIAGQTQDLHLPAGEEEVQGHEFHLIFLEDCYRLSQMSRPIRTVVDIGGNIGLFSLAVLNRFRPEVIHTYEPNPRILPVVQKNLQRSSFRVLGEAVGAGEGTLSLAIQENSLHTAALGEGSGSRETIEVPVISFDRVLERIGGSIDLLKLDCEGAEWELLDREHYWKHVKNLTMEHHLWARPEETVKSLTDRLSQLGFEVLHEHHHADSFGMLYAIRS